MEATPVPQTFLRKLAVLGMLAIGIAIVVFSTQQNHVVNRDFVCYWTSGRQLIHHQNPYDAPAILRLDNSIGNHMHRAFLMRNAPNALFLTLLVAPLSPRAGAILWTLLLLFALVVSVRMIWDMQGRPQGRLHLLGYFFPPVMECILMGQAGLFLLLGFVLFLKLQDRYPFLAGVSLTLCCIKPHLFGVLFVALLAWSVWQKEFRVITGAAIGVLATSVLPLVFDPHVWQHYVHAMSMERIDDDFIPTLSLFFRVAIHRGWFWVQFVPFTLSLLWAFSYFRRKRNQWSWQRHGPLLGAVGVLLAPYAWMSDETIAMPAVLLAICAAARAERSLLPFVIVIAGGLVEVLAGTQPNSGLFLWSAPAWLALYLYGTRGTGINEPAVAPDSGSATHTEAVLVK